MAALAAALLLLAVSQQGCEDIYRCSAGIHQKQQNMRSEASNILWMDKKVLQNDWDSAADSVMKNYHEKWHYNGTHHLPTSAGLLPSTVGVGGLGR